MYICIYIYIYIYSHIYKVLPPRRPGAQLSPARLDAAQLALQDFVSMYANRQHAVYSPCTHAYVHPAEATSDISPLTEGVGGRAYCQGIPRIPQNS